MNFPRANSSYTTPQACRYAAQGRPHTDVALYQLLQVLPLSARAGRWYEQDGCHATGNRSII
jgi:hypothetical protein